MMTATNHPKLDFPFLRLCVLTAMLTPALAWIMTVALQAQSKLPKVTTPADLAVASVRVGLVVAIIGIPLCAVLHSLVSWLSREKLGDRATAFLTAMLMIPMLWYLAVRSAIASYNILLLRSGTVLIAIALACLVSALLLILGCHFLYPSAAKRTVR